MTNPKHPKDDPHPMGSRFPVTGRSARPSAIGEELGGDLDFEPDALLDSLLTEVPPEAQKPSPPPAVTPSAQGAPPAAAPVAAPPVVDDDDEATIVAGSALSKDSIDELLAKAERASSEAPPVPASGPSQPLVATAPPPAALRAGLPAGAPPLPRRRPSPTGTQVPRAAGLPPPPPARGATAPTRPAVSVPRPMPHHEATAAPPAVNPAGPPPREPFLPVHSPEPPRVGPAVLAPTGVPRPQPDKASPPRPAPHAPPRPAPPAPLAAEDEDDVATRMVSPEALGAGIDLPLVSGSGAGRLDQSGHDDEDPTRMFSPSLDQAALDHAGLEEMRLEELGGIEVMEPGLGDASRDDEDPTRMFSPALDALAPGRDDVGPEEEGPTRLIPPDEGFTSGEEEPTVRGTVDALLEREMQRPAGPSTPAPTLEAYEDPVDGLESLPPTGGIVAPFEDAGQVFGEERAAAAHLSERDLRGEWIARASWLQREAESTHDPAARARVLLVASELWTMAEETERAHIAARAAMTASGASPLVGRQVRWLAAADGDFRTVVASLETEMRASPSPAARAHGAYLSAEIHRIKLRDDEGTQRKLELAARIAPSDPRPQLLRAAQSLALGATVPRGAAFDATEFPSLSLAMEQAFRRRAGELATAEDAPAIALQAARRRLQAGETSSAGDALLMLARVEGLERAALWLAASLFAAHRALRPRSIALLRALLAGERSAPAVRALAWRALEQGESQTIRSLLDDGGDVPAFTAADRVALAALTGSDAEAVLPWLTELASEEPLRALAAAALASSSGPGKNLEIECGSARSVTEIALGRALTSRDLQAFRDAFERFVTLHADDALARLLSLELAVNDGDADLVADQLSGWQGKDDDPGVERDRQLAAALVHEQAKHAEAAQAAYAAALNADPTNEAAARALAAGSPSRGASEILATLADAIPDEVHKAILLTEAAIRLGADDPEQVALLKRAQAADPWLPFASHIGERRAQAEGKADELLEWLRAHRTAATDPFERALYSVREALLTADADSGAARSLVEEACEARASDAGLQELLERLAPEPGGTRGQWRELLAEQADETTKAFLLTAAAMEYESAGDLAAAARAAQAAASLGRGALASILFERAAALGPAPNELSERLLEQAATAPDPVAQRELYERLIALYRGRDDTSPLAGWFAAMLAKNPGYLPALRGLEHAHIGAGAVAELEQVAAALVPLLEGGESTAHGVIAAQLRSERGMSSLPLLRQLLDKGETGLFVLRRLAAEARQAQADADLLEAYRLLAERARHSSDKAALAVRAAEAATRLSKLEDAEELLERAVEHTPEHLIALLTRAEVLEQRGDFEGAAIALEAAAQNCKVEAHRHEFWHQAGLLWLDKVQDPQRARIALEHAVEVDVTDDRVFRRLQELYVASDDRGALSELLERRLDSTSDPEERVALEITRGRALAEMGDRAAAKAALSAALDANPEHADALEAFADLCQAEGDHTGAEQALVRLARHANDPDRQASIYRRLGELYEGALDNPQRAELAYKEVLKRHPNDVVANERLIGVYGRLGQPERALELAQALLDRAGSPEEKIRRTLALARVHEEVSGDRKTAEEMLDRARKTWPNDCAVLRGLAEFYARQGETKALQLLLDRSLSDARRALNTGRLEPILFETVATVSELRGAEGALELARATIAVLSGAESELAGTGPRAGARELDELVAPEILNQPFRTLLERCGASLDAAFPYDLRAVRAAPLGAEHAALFELVQHIAPSFGVESVEVYSTPALGPVCLPASSQPARLVLGQKLVESTDDAARFFMLLRSMKILAANAAALSRAAPIDLWPMLAAFLSLLSSGWTPVGVDAQRFEENKSKLRSVLPEHPDPDLSLLALEVGGAVGSRASQLGVTINQWGSRVGLLGVGDLDAALRGIAFSQGSAAGPPRSGAERAKWISRNPEARDLAVFTVSEAYARARKRLASAADS